MGLTIFYILVKISKERLSTNGRFPLAMRAPPDIQATAGAPKRLEPPNVLYIIIYPLFQAKCAGVSRQHDSEFAK